VLHFGVQQSFAIARSHYENINLAAMSPGYNDDELERIEEVTVAPARVLADQIESEVVPWRGCYLDGPGRGA
jgi:hypothetical protein